MTPLPAAAAERIARLAAAHPEGTSVGPRVIAGLLARIDELTAEIDRRDAHAHEAARLRSHSIRAQAMSAGYGATFSSIVIPRDGAV